MLCKKFEDSAYFDYHMSPKTRLPTGNTAQARIRVITKLAWVRATMTNEILAPTDPQLFFSGNKKEQTQFTVRDR